MMPSRGDECVGKKVKELMKRIKVGHTMRDVVQLCA
jgi:hypothetical protein